MSGEALDPRLMELAEGIRLSRRFHLFLAFVDEAPAPGALARAIERHLRAAGEDDTAPDVLTPYAVGQDNEPLRADAVVESVLRPLVEGDGGAGRWLLVDAAPSPARDDAAWEALLPRLNERRNLVVRAQARPLVLALPARLEPALKRLAPDLWSIRSQTTQLDRVGPASRWRRPYRGLAVALVPLAPGVSAWRRCPEAVRSPADEAGLLLRTGAFTRALERVRQAIDACAASHEPGDGPRARALVELFLLECEAALALGRDTEARRALREVQRWRDRAAPPQGDSTRGWYLASVAERLAPLSIAANFREADWPSSFVEPPAVPRVEAFFSLWLGRLSMVRGRDDAAEALAQGRSLATALARRDPRLEAAFCVDLAWLALRTGRPRDAQDELAGARSLLATRARPDDMEVLAHLEGALADALSAGVAQAA